MTEAEAIAGARRGDSAAWAELHRLHRRRVYALCLRMTRNPADAEDLAQEVFLQLFRKVGTFRGESAFSTWLHRLSVNVVLMHLRRKSLPETPLEEFTEPMREDAPPREIGARDQNLAGSIDRVNLERAMERLPPRCRTALVLAAMEGRTLPEVAALMAVAPAAAKLLAWRARDAMRQQLERPQP